MAFTQTYPGGPLSAQAHFLRGEAEARQNAWSAAARAYLDSFSAAPDGEIAPAALTALGRALGASGRPRRPA
jgi:TolA-binding protein